MKSIWEPYKELTEEEFKKARKYSIGASDAHHLVEAAPYGCLRCLYASKLGLSDEISSSVMEAGHFYEPIIADLVEKRHGIKLERVGAAYLEGHGHFRASADRIEEVEGVGYILHEIKRHGQFAFKKLQKEGPLETYKIQLQAQMLCYGLDSGSIDAYWPDGHELVSFHYKRDDELCNALLDLAGMHWKRIEALRLEANPELPPPSKHCTKCVIEKPLDGTEIVADQDMEDALFALKLARAQKKEIEDTEDEVKEYINERAQGATKIMGKSLYATRSERKTGVSVSASIIPELTEEQKLKYTKQSSFIVTTIKEVKK